jgi:segregation and condensation protein A
VATPPEALPATGTGGTFEVHLDNFTGPFDLLLSLISKHRLDITEVALARVTDEFVARIRAADAGEPRWDLGQASEFLVVAATLLDLKAARLLPSGEVEDDEDLALLEARDLLFARLLQYRAFKEVAEVFRHRLDAEGQRFPRSVQLEPFLTNLLPELVVSTTASQLAAVAARALAPRPGPPGVATSHLHAPAVSVREQARLLADRLRRCRVTSFRHLVADADGTVVVVARFLALLEMFRDGAVAFEQLESLGELGVRWTGGDPGGAEFHNEFELPDEFEFRDEFDEGNDGGEDDG